MTVTYKKNLGIICALFLITFLTGCSSSNESGEKHEVDISQIHEKVKQELGEDYLPSREMDIKEIEDLTGIESTDIKKYVAEAPLMSVQVDTFIAIEAKEGKGDAVTEGLETYRTYLVDQSMQYPMNMAKVEAAKVIQHGDYAFFIMLGGMNDSLDADSKEALDFANGEVERVEKVINSFFK